MASSQSGDERAKSSKAPKKKTNEGGEKVYCFCREPEGGRFMIGCDSCDEWYHGSCVGISKVVGKNMELYYCDKCTSEHPNLKIIYKDPDEPNDPPAIPQRCADCINCCTKPDCGTCSRCKAKNGRCLKVLCVLETNANKKQLVKPPPALETRDEPMTEQRDKPRDEKTPESKPESNEEEEDESYSLPSTSRKAGGGGVAGSAKQPLKGRKKGWRGEKEKWKKGGKDKQNGDGSLADRLIVGSDAYLALLEKERKESLSKLGPIQCQGVDCVVEALPKSKYCSDECGMSRAKERISTYLPKGVDNFWRVEPVAVGHAKDEESSKEKLTEELNKEKADLDKWHSLVIDYVQALKPFIPEEKEDVKSDGDFVVSCPVCSVEYGCKIIARHVDKCYAKSEKQTTYGTSSACTVNPNGIFCDQYNKSNESYCKRLRVICPEHYKGDLEYGIEVCGYPRAWFKSESMTLERLFTNVDAIVRKGFCGVSRKDCKKHTGWITLTLGLIDNRRLSYFQKMEDLVEKKSVPMGDALLLMTNHTEYHQPLEKILEMYEEGAKNGGETVLATLLC